MNKKLHNQERKLLGNNPRNIKKEENKNNNQKYE